MLLYYIICAKVYQNMIYYVDIYYILLYEIIYDT